MGDAIGTGQFSIVYKGKVRSNQKEVAIKVIQLEKITLRDLKNIKHETEIMQTFKHPQIIKHL